MCRETQVPTGGTFRFEIALRKSYILLEWVVLLRSSSMSPGVCSYLILSKSDEQCLFDDKISDFAQHHHQPTHPVTDGRL